MVGLLPWERRHPACLVPEDGRRRKVDRQDACAPRQAYRLHPIVAPVVVMLMLAAGLRFAWVNALAFDLSEPSLPTTRPSDLWFFLPFGYLFTVAIETPVLIVGLSRQLSFKQRFFAGLWLTACTYPIVVLVLPIIFASSSRALYLLVAEIFAPVVECALFWFAFKSTVQPGRRVTLRNFGVIVVANLLSFAGGELLNATRWFGLF